MANVVIPEFRELSLKVVRCPKEHMIEELLQIVEPRFESIPVDNGRAANDQFRLHFHYHGVITLLVDDVEKNSCRLRSHFVFRYRDSG